MTDYGHYQCHVCLKKRPTHDHVNTSHSVKDRIITCPDVYPTSWSIDLTVEWPVRAFLIQGSQKCDAISLSCKAQRCYWWRVECGFFCGVTLDWMTERRHNNCKEICYNPPLPHGVGLMLECSTCELLADAALMHCHKPLSTTCAI